MAHLDSACNNTNLGMATGAVAGARERADHGAVDLLGHLGHRLGIAGGGGGETDFHHIDIEVRQRAVRGAEDARPRDVQDGRACMDADSGPFKNATY